ncbi:hypothetical protein DWE98_21025 [Bosea caraganae]|uniref:Uncharacterized protein n=2 Tax=Bosea caraganae TaxID=2763117 RepID=A0A370L1N6_9HYPH|nr:hypothetical protein DWE98_21025 [Bosea caraganae]
MALAATIMLGSAGAEAQTPAYEAGLRVAKSRSYKNPECYARVFSEHARLINHHTKKNFWSIKDGPRFSTAVWSECKISR